MERADVSAASFGRNGAALERRWTLSQGPLSPAAGPLSNAGASAVFLCLHSVHADGPPFLSVPPALFERQLAYLRRRGWRGGRLRDLDALRSGGRVAHPLAFLTFDDGYADNCDVALPLLREHEFTPIVFLLPRLVDESMLRWPAVVEAIDHHPEAMRPLTWAQVDAMAAEGAEFGAHSLNHAVLTALSDEELAQDLLDSRRRIAERVGACDVLAYPFGLWDLRVATAAVAAGYRYGFSLQTSSHGRATSMSIPRLLVDHRDEPRRLAIKLNPLVRRALMSPRLRSLRRVRGIEMATQGAARRAASTT